MQDNINGKLTEQGGISVDVSEYYSKLAGIYDELIEKNRDAIMLFSGEKITTGLFGNRAANALHRNDIHTIGDLVSKSGAEICGIKFLGYSSMRALINGLAEIVSYEGRSEELEKKLTGLCGDAWTPLRERVQNIISARRFECMAGRFAENDSLVGLFTENDYLQMERLIAHCIHQDAKIKERDREILLKRNIENRTLQEIGEEYDISRERVRQLCEKGNRRYMARLKHGTTDNSYEELIRIISAYSDEKMIAFLIFLRQKNNFITDCLFYVLFDTADIDFVEECVDLCIEIERISTASNPEQATEQSGNGSAVTAGTRISIVELSALLPKVGYQLINLGAPQYAIDLSKKYTDLYRKQIWTQPLFIMIADAYLATGNLETARKFADIAKAFNKDDEGYLELERRIRKGN